MATRGTRGSRWQLIEAINLSALTLHLSFSMLSLSSDLSIGHRSASAAAHCRRQVATA